MILSRLDAYCGHVDQLYFFFRNRFSRHSRWFSRGWGSDAAIAAVVKGFNRPAPPADISIEWEAGRTSVNGVVQRIGSFSACRYEEYLPAESRRVYLKKTMPADIDAPVVILLPTTREEGFAGRDKTALALALNGIGSISIEAAFLGKRRPAQQPSATLMHLSDFFLLCGSAIEESRALLKWLVERGTHRLAIAGVSKGGYIAAAAGAMVPFPVAIAAVVPPHSGTDVYVDGLTHYLCDWKTISATCPHQGLFASHLAELFGKTELTTLAPPAFGAPVILVGARRDRFVPWRAYAAMKQCWPHLELRWLSGGHVSSIAESSHLINAIQDGIRQLRVY